MHTSVKASFELNTSVKCRVTWAVKSSSAECAEKSSRSSAVGSRRASARYAETMAGGGRRSRDAGRRRVQFTRALSRLEVPTTSFSSTATFRTA